MFDLGPVNHEKKEIMIPKIQRTRTVDKSGAKNVLGTRDGFIMWGYEGTDSPLEYFQLMLETVILLITSINEKVYP